MTTISKFVVCKLCHGRGFRFWMRRVTRDGYIKRAYPIKLPVGAEFNDSMHIDHNSNDIIETYRVPCILCNKTGWPQPIPISEFYGRQM